MWNKTIDWLLSDTFDLKATPLALSGSGYRDGDASVGADAVSRRAGWAVARDRGGAAATLEAETRAARGGGEAGGSAPATASMAPDLVQAISMLLRDRDELIGRANSLERRSASPVDPQEAFRTMKNMVPILDALDRVLAFGREQPASAQMDNWLKSIEGVYYRLLQTLERQGLEPIDAVGKAVDLDCQEVVEYLPAAGVANETVVAERQKGYRFKGRLLRDAKVVVAFNPTNG